MNRKPTIDELESAVWIAHGMVMQGGVLHAIEVLTPQELRMAIAGYRRFGVPGAAQAIEQGQKLSKSERSVAEAGLDRDYAIAVPDDAFLSSSIDRANPIVQLETSTSNQGGVGDVISSAISEFTEWSIESQRLSTSPGKTRHQHRASDRVTTAVRTLLSVWDSGGHDAFLRLLDHSNDVVRAAAAAFLVESDPEKAIPVIEAIDAGPPSPARLITLGVRHAMKWGNYKPLTRLRSPQSKGG